MSAKTTLKLSIDCCRAFGVSARGSTDHLPHGILENPPHVQWPRNGTVTIFLSMKKLRLLSLVSITSIALTYAAWAGPHGGGGGGFGGGGFHGGGGRAGQSG